MCHIDYISFMWFSHKCEKKRKWINHSVRTFWSPLTSELVTSTEYMAVIKSHHFPPPPPPLFLFLFLTRGGGGEEGARRGQGRLCSCLGGRSVRGGGEGGCLFEDSARSPRLPGSLKLFDDRTGQHHCRWGGGGVGCVCRGAVGHLYTAVSFILSSSPSSSSSHFSISALPLLFLCCCCFTPSPRPLQAL